MITIKELKKLTEKHVLIKNRLHSVYIPANYYEIIILDISPSNKYIKYRSLPSTTDVWEEINDFMSHWEIVEILSKPKKRSK